MSQVVKSREDVIREWAYLKWEQAGSPEGDGVNFWLDAEAEFEAEFSDALDETLEDVFEEVNLDAATRVRIAAK